MEDRSSGQRNSKGQTVGWYSSVFDCTLTETDGKKGFVYTCVLEKQREAGLIILELTAW